MPEPEPPAAPPAPPPAVPPAGQPSPVPPGQNAGQTTPAQPAEEKPEFHKTFLKGSLIAAGATAGVVLVIFGLVFWLDNDWEKLTASARLAATLAVPITVLGVLLVCTGAALAGTEWRGTLKDPPPPVETRDAAVDVPKVIEAVGKLRGPALMIVAGALLLGGSAWIASSAAKAPVPEKPTTSGTQPPSGSPS
jgi:hypothetical protein